MCGGRDAGRAPVAAQKKLGAGISGGAGVVFQKLPGEGTARVQLAGEITECELKAGESLLIHPGHLAMFRAELAAAIEPYLPDRNPDRA